VGTCADNEGRDQSSLDELANVAGDLRQKNAEWLRTNIIARLGRSPDDFQKNSDLVLSILDHGDDAARECMLTYILEFHPHVSEFCVVLKRHACQDPSPRARDYALSCLGKAYLESPDEEIKAILCDKCTNTAETDYVRLGAYLSLLQIDICMNGSAAKWRGVSKRSRALRDFVTGKSIEDVLDPDSLVGICGPKT
jgi:hypothetical protein